MAVDTLIQIGATGQARYADCVVSRLHFQYTGAAEVVDTALQERPIASDANLLRIGIVVATGSVMGHTLYPSILGLGIDLVDGSIATTYYLIVAIAHDVFRASPQLTHYIFST